MFRSRRIRHVPVVRGDKIIGILSDRDLRRAKGRGQTGCAVAEVGGETKLITGSPRDRVSEIAKRLIDARISSFPIVDGDTLVGICTSTDITDHCMNTLWEPEDPSTSHLVPPLRQSTRAHSRPRRRRAHASYRGSIVGNTSWLRRGPETPAFIVSSTASLWIWDSPPWVLCMATMLSNARMPAW